MAISDNAKTTVVVHPGKKLDLLLDDRGADLQWLAKVTGIAHSTLASFHRGKVDVNDELATALARAFDTSAGMWYEWQYVYEQQLELRDQRAEAASEIHLLEDFKVKEAMGLGWFPHHRNRSDQVIATREFLDVQSLREFEPKLFKRFRNIGRSRSDNVAALGMWLRKGEIEADAQSVDSYDSDLFADVLLDIRRLTRRSPFAFLPELKELCAQAGVIFIVVESLPTVRAHGVTDWRDDGTPWIQASFKGNWLDRFWFTFFHEAAHVLQGKPEPDELVDAETWRMHERDANQRAEDWLIPRDQWNAILRLGKFDKSDIIYQADRLGIHPGIIVNRLQWQGKLLHDDREMNQLRGRVTITERRELAAINISNSQDQQSDIPEQLCPSPLPT